MAKSSRLSDYEINYTPSGKARLLFKFCFLMEEVKKGLMSLIFMSGKFVSRPLIFHLKSTP